MLRVGGPAGTSSSSRTSSRKALIWVWASLAPLFFLRNHQPAARQSAPWCTQRKGAVGEWRGLSHFPWSSEMLALALLRRLMLSISYDVFLLRRAATEACNQQQHPTSSSTLDRELGTARHC